MKKENDIDLYFKGALKNIDLILNDNFYHNKEVLKEVRQKIQKWYDYYQNSGSLMNIDVKELEFLDLEITDFFTHYVETESIKKNYSERLYYDFSHLERYWKDEMLGGNENV